MKTQKNETPLKNDISCYKKTKRNNFKKWDLMQDIKKHTLSHTDDDKLFREKQQKL